MTDAALATAIAQEAGALLQTIRAEGMETGKALGDRGDREANALILARLSAARPDDFILSEESIDDRRRCGASRVWIVDPLDGTREYAGGLDDWAVHIGLAIDGRPAVGAVAVPGMARTWSTTDDRAPFTPLPARPRVVVSRTRCPGYRPARRRGAGRRPDRHGVRRGEGDGGGRWPGRHLPA